MPTKINARKKNSDSVFQTKSKIKLRLHSLNNKINFKLYPRFQSNNNILLIPMQKPTPKAHRRRKPKLKGLIILHAFRIKSFDAVSLVTVC